MAPGFFYARKKNQTEVWDCTAGCVSIIAPSDSLVLTGNHLVVVAGSVVEVYEVGRGGISRLDSTKPSFSGVFGQAPKPKVGSLSRGPSILRLETLSQHLVASFVSFHAPTSSFFFLFDGNVFFLPLINPQFKKDIPCMGNQMWSSCNTVSCITFSDSNWGVSGHVNGLVTTFRIPGGEPIRTFQAHSGVVTCMLLWQDRLFSVGLDGWLRQFRVETGVEVRKWKVPQRDHQELRLFEGNGSVFVVLQSSNGLHLVDVLSEQDELAVSFFLCHKVLLWRCTEGQGHDNWLTVVDQSGTISLFRMPKANSASTHLPDVTVVADFSVSLPGPITGASFGVASSPPLLVLLSDGRVVHCTVPKPFPRPIVPAPSCIIRLQARIRRNLVLRFLKNCAFSLAEGQMLRRALRQGAIKEFAQGERLNLLSDSVVRGSIIAALPASGRHMLDSVAELVKSHIRLGSLFARASQVWPPPGLSMLKPGIGEYLQSVLSLSSMFLELGSAIPVLAKALPRRSPELRGFTLVSLLNTVFLHFRAFHASMLLIFSCATDKEVLLNECGQLFRLSLVMSSIQEKAQRDLFRMSYICENDAFENPARVVKLDCDAEWQGSPGHRVVVCSDGVLIISPSTEAADKRTFKKTKKPAKLMDFIPLAVVSATVDVGKQGVVVMEWGSSKAKFVTTSCTADAWIVELQRAKEEVRVSKLGMDLNRVLFEEDTNIPVLIASICQSCRQRRSMGFMQMWFTQLEQQGKEVTTPEEIAMMVWQGQSKFSTSAPGTQLLALHYYLRNLPHALVPVNVGTLLYSARNDVSTLEKLISRLPQFVQTVLGFLLSFVLDVSSRGKEPAHERHLFSLCFAHDIFRFTKFSSSEWLGHVEFGHEVELFEALLLAWPDIWRSRVMPEKALESRPVAGEDGALSSSASPPSKSGFPTTTTFSQRARKSLNDSAFNSSELDDAAFKGKNSRLSRQVTRRVNANSGGVFNMDSSRENSREVDDDFGNVSVEYADMVKRYPCLPHTTLDMVLSLFLTDLRREKGTQLTQENCTLVDKEQPSRGNSRVDPELKPASGSKYVLVVTTSSSDEVRKSSPGSHSSTKSSGEGQLPSPDNLLSSGRSSDSPSPPPSQIASATTLIPVAPTKVIGVRRRPEVAVRARGATTASPADLARQRRSRSSGDIQMALEQMGGGSGGGSASGSEAPYMKLAPTAIQPTSSASPSPGSHEKKHPLTLSNPKAIPAVATMRPSVTPLSLVTSSPAGSVPSNPSSSSQGSPALASPRGSGTGSSSNKPSSGLMQRLIRKKDSSKNIVDDKPSAAEGKEAPVMWSNVKLVVVGQENVGKTHLCRHLENSKYDLNISTDGIEIGTWSTGKGRNQISFTTFDFGGQDIFYPTHQFFLTARCVYVVVFRLDASDFMERVMYWVRTIDATIRNAAAPPVILVGTHRDESTVTDAVLSNIRSELDGVARRFKMIRDIIFVSCTKGTNIPQLKTTVMQVAIGAKLALELVPRYYVDMWESVQNKAPTKPFVSFDEFKSMAQSCNVPMDISFDVVTKFLHDVGRIIHFGRGDARVERMVVLDPAWLASRMSDLISFKQNWPNGVVDMARLRIIWKQFDDQRKEEILSVLERFQVVFVKRARKKTASRLGGEGRSNSITGDFPITKVIVPCLLPESIDLSVAARGLRPEQGLLLHKRMLSFKWIPLGFAARLISIFRSHREYKMTEQWRTGVILATKSGERGIVECESDYKQNTFKLFITTSASRNEEGRRKRSLDPKKALMHELVSIVDGLVRDICSDASVKRDVVCSLCMQNKPESTPVLFPFEILVQLFTSNKQSIVCSGCGNSVPISLIAPDITFSFLPIIDHVDLGSRLGRGGFAAVYRGVLEDGTVVAVKELLVAGDEEAVLDKFRQFQHEVFMMSRVNHPNLVRMFGIMLQPKPRIIMEFCPLPDLSYFLYGKDPKKPILSYGQKLIIAFEVASGLAYLHAQSPPIVHRDVRSPNVFIVSLDPGTGVIAKLGDYGLAASVVATLTESLPTFQWMAPEVLNGAQYDESVDIYSLSMVMLELIANKLPFCEFHTYFSKFTQWSTFYCKRCGENEICVQSEACQDQQVEKIEVGEKLVWKEQKVKDAIIHGNLRPSIPPYCPAELASLIQSGWSRDASARPTASQMAEALLDIMGKESSFSPTLVKKMSVALSSRAKIDARVSDFDRDSSSLHLDMPKLVIANPSFVDKLSVSICSLLSVETILWAGLSNGDLAFVSIWKEDGAVAASGTANVKSVKIISAHSGRLTSMLAFPHLDVVWTAGDDGQVVCWNSSVPRKPKKKYSLKGHSGIVSCMASWNNYGVTCYESGDVVVWQLTEKDTCVVEAVDSDLRSVVHCCCVIDNGVADSTLIVGTCGKIFLFNLSEAVRSGSIPWFKLITCDTSDSAPPISGLCVLQRKLWASSSTKLFCFDADKFEMQRTIALESPSPIISMIPVPFSDILLFWVLARDRFFVFDSGSAAELARQSVPQEGSKVWFSSLCQVSHDTVISADTFGRIYSWQFV